jgi:hypothetical protein
MYPFQTGNIYLSPVSSPVVSQKTWKKLETSKWYNFLLDIDINNTFIEFHSNPPMGKKVTWCKIL